MTLSMTAMLAYCLSQGPCADAAAGAKLAENGQLAEAIPIFQCHYAHALAAGEKHQAALSAGYLGTLLRFQGEIARAIPLLRFAKANLEQGSPSQAVVRAQLGMALAQDGKPAHAEIELRDAGPHPSVRVHLAAVYLQQGKILQARGAAEEVLRSLSAQETAPARAMQALAYLTLARVHATTGSHSGAAENYRNAIRLYESLPFPVPDYGEAMPVKGR
jgi:tetratricopeptide (TPR) repeat protein